MKNKLLFWSVYLFIVGITLMASLEAERCGCSIISIFIAGKLILSIVSREMHDIVEVLVDPFERRE